ncbi:MAG: peptidylprolyl isomerase [Acidobacteriota bacterium]|nr:peptidylprolyl isomerase [Acidobacteriota bacterium]MDH3786499.1 peptidylprolyl isomerase [Acidobacteriota bacterium]
MSPLPADIPTFDDKKEVFADFTTTHGKFTAKLFASQCPQTVGNFVGLARGDVEWTAPNGEKVKKPLYDGTIFHRVISEFMIQGGDPLGNGTGGPGYNFADEIVPDLKHDKPGILSMANAGPGTNGSQFFLTEVATPWLDGKHTVFGEISDGMDVVMKIAKSPTGHGDKPSPDIKIESIKIRS